MFDFHRSDRGSNPGRGGEFHNDKHYTLVSSVNPTCHPFEGGKWVPVKLLGSNCENTREWSGTLPYHFVEAIEKGAFGSPSTSVGQIELIYYRKKHCFISKKLNIRFSISFKIVNVNEK